MHVHDLVCTCVCTVHENICAFVNALHEHVCTCVHILLCMCVLVQDKGQSEMSASETPSTLSRVPHWPGTRSPRGLVVSAAPAQGRQARTTMLFTWVLGTGFND